MQEGEYGENFSWLVDVGWLICQVLPGRRFSVVAECARLQMTLTCKSFLKSPPSPLSTLLLSSLPPLTLISPPPAPRFATLEGRSPVTTYTYDFTKIFDATPFLRARTQTQHANLFPFLGLHSFAVSFSSLLNLACIIRNRSSFIASSPPPPPRLSFSLSPGPRLRRPTARPPRERRSQEPHHETPSSLLLGHGQGSGASREQQAFGEAGLDESGDRED